MMFKVFRNSGTGWALHGLSDGITSYEVEQIAARRMSGGRYRIKASEFRAVPVKAEPPSPLRLDSFQRHNLRAAGWAF